MFADSSRIAMLSFSGAPGDHLHINPALRQLRRQVKSLLMTAEWKGGIIKSLYEHSGLVDKFVWLDSKQMEGWTEDQLRVYMLQETAGYEITEYHNLNGIIAGGFMHMPPFNRKPREARGRISKKTFYDLYCDALGVPEAKGLRPKIKLGEADRSWLRNYRTGLGIDKAIRLVGYQWSGSAKVKEIPYAFEIISKLLSNHNDIYIVAMGSERFKEALIPEGRCANLAGLIKWRQAAILTQEMSLYIAPDTSIMVAAHCYKDVPKILLATTTSGEQIAFPETAIIQSTARCSPCYRITDTCDLDNCCEAFDVDEIVETADKILKG